MTTSTSRALAIAAALSLAAPLTSCDGGGGGDDAGPPDAGTRPAIVLTINSIQLQAAVVNRSGGSILPNFGDQFYVANVTLEAVSEGPLPVAPIAFTLTLDDDSDVNADTDSTNSAMDGCDSRSVPVGDSTTCVVSFEVPTDVAPARSITWSNGGSLSAVARVPAG